ncbi:hypothetical protein [Afipia clevelandensis]|uniref:Uncharacterized protein n=1 Tax=Afipia clevelandensis ATCC 49720 TaxID=883079 RepID=K8PFU1_9BRAD|nr:hypothetical protein [Afipia clevelandensis]EKS40411.1 hypothetical protein HMPREF9696_00862 [Afipia clevelandensis ATCC 49720]
MTSVPEPYVASLYRQGELEPYLSKVLEVGSWSDAARAAHEFAIVELGEGVMTPTSLHLKHGAQGKFLKDFTPF